MRGTILAVALATLSTPALAGEVWSVVEGPQGRTLGVWNIEKTGGGFTGNAVMRGADGRPVTYVVSGTIDGATYTAQRQSPSDGQMCSYTGMVEPPKLDHKGLEIKGTASCRESSGPWRVVEAKPSK